MNEVGAVHIVEPGLQTTVQDYPGRIGFWRVGIPPSGPMDDLAFRLANSLVDNPPGAAAIEAQFVGPTMTFETDAVIALSGGDCAAILDQTPVPFWQTTKVRAGQTLRCPAVRSGARFYVAVGGGLRRDMVLGSRATFVGGGIGGGALKSGDRLEFDLPCANVTSRRVKADCIPRYPVEIEAEVTVGPHADWLDESGMARLLAGPWRITGRSDRTGIRLAGPKLSFSRRALNKAPEHGSDPTNVINTGYPIGGVNLCGDTPIILPVDGPSQGGFITPLVVTSAALWKIGQARPGNILRFRLVGVDEAIDLRRALERWASVESLEPNPSNVHSREPGSVAPI
jgi:5-oxoprolinase (ATP-hydrolysing) subunit C